jgi:hypothetical protein
VLASKSEQQDNVILVPYETAHIRLNNQTFVTDGFRDPILRQRGERELPYIAEVRDHLSQRTAIIPWNPVEPVGPERLREMASTSKAARDRDFARG